ncbi:MAG TPA: hypothetical protein PLH57_01640 [Oligoflexia bacterium]|nr:hypothetical protein [Oligoflexia bacterium]
MGKKKKFDLSHLVHEGYLKDGDSISFVSDPSKTAKIMKQPNGEYKLKVGKETVTTLHAYSMELLGQEPPNHASCWFKAPNGKTLYELWHADDYVEAA